MNNKDDQKKIKTQSDVRIGNSLELALMLIMLATGCTSDYIPNFEIVGHSEK